MTDSDVPGLGDSRMSLENETERKEKEADSGKEHKCRNKQEKHKAWQQTENAKGVIANGRNKTSRKQTEKAKNITAN